MSEESKTYTGEEFLALPEAEQRAILKHPAVKMEGTAVVRKADGTIRYDDDAEPGKYHEKGDGNG